MEKTTKQAMTYFLWQTPPRRSVYVKWKLLKIGPVLSSSFDIEHVFKKYGTIERVMICSLRSTIVVFDLIQPACNAATESNAATSYYILVK